MEDFVGEKEWKKKRNSKIKTAVTDTLGDRV